MHNSANTPDRTEDPLGAKLPVQRKKDWHKPLRAAWRAVKLLVQVNGVVQLVQNGESPAAHWAREALDVLHHVIHMLAGG